MTLEKYKTIYNNAPYDLKDFALGATMLDIELADIAINYLNARQQFENELEKLNIKVG